MSTSENRDGDVQEQFTSLLDGLRTTLPGVQLITAFLLTVPFYDHYPDLTRPERVAYYLAFISAVVGSVLLMAPSAHQRLRAHDGIQRHSEHHLDIAVRLTVVGTVAFAIALTAATYLVSSVVVGTGAAVAVTVVVGLTAAWTWFYLPLVTFERQSAEP